MDFRLQLVLIPVSDVDRAKAFYTDTAGFTLDTDHQAGENFRVVQCTPPRFQLLHRLRSDSPRPGRVQRRGCIWWWRTSSEPTGS